jgi:hypothetical protein
MTTASRQGVPTRASDERDLKPGSAALLLACRSGRFRRVGTLARLDRLTAEMKDSFPGLISKEFAMTVTQIRDQGQTLRVPRNKVVGIADTRAVFDETARALEAAGFEEIEALSGQEGVNLLERIHTFFFSDMEDRMLANHIKELKADHIIMLIETPGNRVNEAVSVASQHGAHCLVHFGLATVAWLAK